MSKINLSAIGVVFKVIGVHADVVRHRVRHRLADAIERGDEDAFEQAKLDVVFAIDAGATGLLEPDPRPWCERYEPLMRHEVYNEPPAKRARGSAAVAP